MAGSRPTYGWVKAYVWLGRAKAYVALGEGIRFAGSGLTFGFPAPGQLPAHPTLGINMRIDIMPPRLRVRHAVDPGP